MLSSDANPLKKGLSSTITSHNQHLFSNTAKSTVEERFGVTSKGYSISLRDPDANLERPATKNDREHLQPIEHFSDLAEKRTRTAIGKVKHYQ
jgi:hypothetical protein